MPNIGKGETPMRVSYHNNHYTSHVRLAWRQPVGAWAPRGGWQGRGQFSTLTLSLLWVRGVVAWCRAAVRHGLQQAQFPQQLNQLSDRESR
jgi:hypothetical protein